MSLWQALARWYAGRPAHTRVLLALALTVLVVELLLRRFARGSAAYRRWTALFLAVGQVWTAVLLSIIYALSVGPVSLSMRLLGKDPLDRSLAAEPSFWRAHDPNPLGPLRAARHQF
jgi:F0F1-type ATP synthase membrane subunit a